jgi:hypothetical protein
VWQHFVDFYANCWMKKDENKAEPSAPSKDDVPDANDDVPPTIRHPAESSEEDSDEGEDVKKKKGKSKAKQSFSSVRWSANLLLLRSRRKGSVMRRTLLADGKFPRVQQKPKLSRDGQCPCIQRAKIATRTLFMSCLHLMT